MKGAGKPSALETVGFSPLPIFYQIAVMHVFLKKRLFLLTNQDTYIKVIIK
jgi:hypothetical protein